MLWYKSWLDTRWRFLIGFVLLTLMACGVIVNWQVSEPLLPILANQQPATSTLAGRIAPVGQTWPHSEQLGSQ